MTTATEAALAGLHAALETKFRQADMPCPVRNRQIPEEAPEWPRGAVGAPRLFLGFVDGETRVDARLVSGGYDLTQAASVEIIVEDSVDARRLETFSSCLEKVAAAVEGIVPTNLGAGVSTVEVEGIERENLVTDGTSGTSAAVVLLTITLWSERPF
jgi:hypothetical protein